MLNRLTHTQLLRYAGLFTWVALGIPLVVLPMALSGRRVWPLLWAAPRGLICVARDLGIDQPIWLVTQSDLAKSRRVEAVATFLRGLVHTHKAALSG